jgi:hypothetical protein
MFHTLMTLDLRKPLKDKGLVSIASKNVVTDMVWIYRVRALIFVA